MEYLTFPQSIPITAISKIKAHSYERDGAVVAIIMLIISRSTFVRGSKHIPIFSFVFPRSCCNTSLFNVFSTVAPNKSTQPCYKCRPHNHKNNTHHAAALFMALIYSCVVPFCNMYLPIHLDQQNKQYRFPLVQKNIRYRPEFNFLLR